jgi:MFS family permease
LILTSVGITSVTQQTLLNGFLQLWNLLIAVIAASMVDKLGRRILFLTSAVGMLCTYIAITGLSGSFANTGVSAIGTAVIPFLFIYYAFYDIAFTPLLVAYPVEIWPYGLRARGVAVTLTTTLAAVFFNIFVNPIALQAIAWKYYIVYIVMGFLIVITIYYTYPETRGHSLEEMAFIFDGESAEVPQDGVILNQIQQQKEVNDDATHVEEINEKTA